MVSLLLVLVVVMGWGCSRKPRSLVIAFTNDMRGFVRSCGCSHKDYGGLARRATLIEALRDTAECFVAVDAGDMFGAGINYGKSKAQLTARALATMGYDAVVPGEQDFVFGLEFLAELARETDLPVVLANLVDPDSKEPLFPPSRLVSKGGNFKIAFIGLMSDRLPLPRAVTKGEVLVLPPEEVLKEQVAALPSDVDLVIVLGHMALGDAMALAGKIPGVDLFMCGHDGRVLRGRKKFGDAFLLESPSQGRILGIAYARLGRAGEVKKLDVYMEPLSSLYADHVAVQELFSAYDRQVEAQEKALLAEAAPIDSGYAGADGCSSCHRQAYEKWMGTAHSRAFEVLARQGRSYDRDCTPCHTTGFEHGGFVSPTLTPSLEGVQCEACHGPAAEHMREPRSAPTGQDERACRRCHTGEMSPEFRFEDYWKRIAH